MSEETLTDEMKDAFAEEYRKQGGKSKLEWIKEHEDEPCERCIKDDVLCIPRRNTSGGATQCDHCSQKGKCSKPAQECQDRVCRRMNLTQNQYDVLQAWYLAQKRSANASNKDASPSRVPKRKVPKRAKCKVITEDSKKPRSLITAKRKRPTNTRQTTSSKATSVLATDEPPSSKRRTLAGGSKAVDSISIRSPTPEDNDNLILSQPTHAPATDNPTSSKRRTLAGRSNGPEDIHGDKYDYDATPDTEVENVTPAPEDSHAEAEHVHEDNDVGEVDKLLLTESRAEIEEGDHSDHSDKELVYPPTRSPPKRRKTSIFLKSRTPSPPILNTCSSPNKRKINAFSRSRSHSPVLGYSFHDTHIVPDTEDEAPDSGLGSEPAPAVSSVNLHKMHAAAPSPAATVSIQQSHSASVLRRNHPSSVGVSGETVFRTGGPPGSRIHIIVETPASSNTGPMVRSSPTAIALPGQTKVVNTLRDIQHTLENLSTDFRFSRRPVQECVALFNDNIDRLKNTITDIQ
ncbi:hypothetical protein VNI00_014735 [Paramarasmius palmivorus]|uniref:Uncharacterized protein n=1 Tax=Paramarasmius palmivorus TaxID=297713 RepID=A0AAW0BQA6_9AGAR